MLKKSTLLFLSVFLLLAFSISPVEAAKAVCGNAICEKGENSNKCPEDCPGGGGGNGGGKGDVTPLKVHLSGAFVFRNDSNEEVALDASWDGRDTTSIAKIKMTRPGDGGPSGPCDMPTVIPSSLAETWDKVFCSCMELVDVPPTSFEADDSVLHIDTVEVEQITLNSGVISLSGGPSGKDANVGLQLRSDPNAAMGIFPPPTRMERSILTSTGSVSMAQL